jgi:tetratricopeptide (TPR) repeat protein
MVLAAGSVSGGDPDVADLLFKKAKKAFSAKDYADAESGFRRALKELTPYPEARLGLAESLEKLERPREAIEEYRNCIAEIDAAGAPSRWKPLRSRAQQALSRLQGRHAELEKLNDAFVRKCIDFGKKRAKSDPYWARKAYETVLLLDPGNDVAKGLLKTLPLPEDAEPEPQSKRPSSKQESLFRRELWDGAPEWSVDEDRITGDVREPDGKLFWLDKIVLEGTYSASGKFRMTHDGGPRRAYGMFFAGDGRNWWAVVFDDHEKVVLEQWTQAEQRNVGDHMLADFDHSAWHTLEIAVKPGHARILLDGKEILDREEDDRSCFAGKICLFVQNACVEWRELEVSR